MCFIQVLGTADEQITRVLGSVAQNWLSWFIKVRKVKAIYHTLNMFLVQPRNYVAECWCRVADIPYIQTALNRGGVNIAYVNPFHVEATFIHSSRMDKLIENHLNPVMLVFIGKLSLITNI